MNSILSIASFLLCGQCIACSSAPMLFIAIAAAGVAVFLLAREKSSPLFLMIALGPVLNMTVIHRDPYVYNIEIVLLAFLGCWFWKKVWFPDAIKDRAVLSYLLLSAVIFTAGLIHTFVEHKDVLAEIRLVRLYVIGGLVLLFLKRQTVFPWRVFFRATVITALVISSGGLVGYLIQILTSGNWYREPGSMFGGSEMLAVYICSTVPFLLIGKPTGEDAGWARLSALAASLSAVLLLATRSRAGLCALLLFFLFHFANRYRTKNFLKTWRIGAILLLFATALIAIGVKTYHFPPRSIENAVALLFSSRAGVWAMGMESFQRFPWWGSGAGENVYNLYLQILCQFGGLGLGAFFCFLFCIFKQYYAQRGARAAGRIHAGLFWSAIAFLIANFGESGMGNQFGYYSLFIFFMVGLTAAGSRDVSGAGLR
jgi:O-antigen ligase